MNNNLKNRGIDLEDLLAAPALAIAKANSSMAQQQVKFIIDTCFITKENDTYQPKMILMSLIKHNLDGEELVLDFQIPLLTIVPLNSLCIKESSVKCDLEITSHNEQSVDTTESQKIKLKGKVSNNDKTDSKSLSKRTSRSSISVEMKTDSIPLPLGITTILDYYIKNIGQ